MKIVFGNEPLFCDASDASYKILMDIGSTNNDKELSDSLRNWMPLKLESMVQLADWKKVLNKLDLRICNIMHAWRHEIILSAETSGDQPPESADLLSDLDDLKLILRFTSSLLRNAINKEVYNSAEYLVELLCAYEDEMMILALDALLALALPPLSHRCNLDMTRHLTSLHKNVSYFDALFEILEASFFACAVPIPEFLDADFMVTPEMRRAKVDFKSRSKYLKNVLVSDSNGETAEIETLLKPENCFEIVDVWVNTKNLKDIVQQNAAKLAFGLKFSLMCMVRMRRLLRTVEGRMMLLRLQFQAATILLGCHPDSVALSNYFEDKIDLIKNFMFLLRTGPGSLDYRPETVDIDIRLLACQCLEAIVGSRDHSSTPIFTRYPWIVQDLGLNRGQYMGLLPCMVRAMTSYLVSLDTGSGVASTASEEEPGAEESKMHVEDSSSAVAKRTDESPEEQETRLVWIEHVFMLLIAIVNITAALPALTDNGLVGSILLVLDRLDLSNRSTTMMFVEVMCIEILESSVTSHPPAMVSFKEKNGMEVVINRLHRELVDCLVDHPTDVVALPQESYSATRATSGSLSVASSIIIQEFFSLLTSVLQEDRSPASDHGQWYKLPALTQSLKLIFANAHAVGSLILSPAVSLLSEIINSDAAPPTILSYMISSGVCKEALLVLTGKIAEGDQIVPAPELPSGPIAFSGDLILSLVGMMSSLSLTADGIALVTAVSPFKAVFSVFTDARYVYPQSRVVMSDLPNLLGSNLEELIRHYPTYANVIIDELIASMNAVSDMAEPFVGTENYQTGENGFTAEFEEVLHHAVALLLCLEALVLHKPTVVLFHSSGGFTAMRRFLRIAFGPPRYFIDSFACTIDSTVSCIGYTPIVALLISRCMSRIAEVERKLLLEFLLSDLRSTVDTLQNDLTYHWDHFNQPELPSSVARHIPITLSGNGNPLLEGFLDTVTRDPVQDCNEDDKTPPKLLSFIRVARGFTLVDCLTEGLGIVMNQRTSGGQWEECFAMLTDPSGLELIDIILNKLYIPTQLEMARARGMFMNSTKDSCVKVHPVYHIMVVASDAVAVKDSIEDSAVRLCKLGRGCVVEAYERRSTATSSVLKYRTKDGWISTFRTAQSSDPQILVVKTTKKSPDAYAEEVARNQSIYNDPEQRSDFEKFANISAKRAGFLALYHFNHSIKTHLLSLLSKEIYSYDAGISIMPSDNCTINAAASHCVSLLVNCIQGLILDIPMQSPKSEFDLESIASVNHSKTPDTRNNPTGKGGSGGKRSRFARSNAAASVTFGDSAASTSSAPSVAATNSILKETYFHHGKVPALDEFPTSHVYASIRLAELANSLIFMQRRGRIELNPLLIAHLLYDADYLERVFFLAGQVFQCSLPDLAIETEDNPAYHHLYSGKWYPLNESDLDAAVEAESESTSSSSTVEVEEAVVEKPSGKGKGKGRKQAAKSKVAGNVQENSGFTPFSSYLSYRRAVRERRLLAVSSIDNTINLWKLLCASVGTPGSTPAERTLQKESTDERDYDPLMMKRQILTCLCKYLVPIWSHPNLHVLPPATVKNVIDLMAVAIKTLGDHKAVSTLRASLPSSSSSSGIGSDLPRMLSRFGSRRLPSNSSSTGTIAAPPTAPPVNEFVVSEECIATLQEMGFTRRAIIRAATMLRSNNANHLVPHLLENPFYFNEPEPAPSPAVPSTTPAAAASAPPAEASTATSTSGPAADEGDDTSAAAAGAGTSSSAPPAAPRATSNGDGEGEEEDGTDMERMIENDLWEMFTSFVDHGRSAVEGRPSRSASSSSSANRSYKGEESSNLEEKKSNPLPLIPKQLDVSLKLERELENRILKCIYGDVPSLCVSLIEHGPTKHLALLDTDMKNVNSGITREVFTVMVLNQMLKCLEKNNLPDSLLRIVQLSWLYHRAIAVLSEGCLTVDTQSTLFGLLHAILVLLTSKMISANTRTPSSCSEMLFLIFTLDDRYSKLYPLLVDALEKYANELTSSSDGLEGVKPENGSWISPALLILDIVAQPILVDAEALRSSMAELDGYVKYNPRTSQGDNALTLTTPGDAILSEQVRAVFAKKFLSRKSSSLSGFPSFDDMLYNVGPQRKSGRSFDGLFDFSFPALMDKEPTSSSSADAGGKRGRGKGKAAKKAASPACAEPESNGTPIKATEELVEPPLPLFDAALDGELKTRCLTVSVTLLRAFSNGKTDGAAVPQASMQLIAHLTRHPVNRKVFHDLRGGVFVLRCKSRFDGMPSVVFTLLQQVLEDEKYLTQSMITAVRLCLLRLSERKTKSVLLKSFLEVICPVVLREQNLFMKVLKENTQLKNISGQIFISWKDQTSAEQAAPPAAAIDSSTVPAQGTSSSSTSNSNCGSSADPAAIAGVAPSAPAGSAAKRARMNDGSAAVTAAAQSASKPAPATTAAVGNQNAAPTSGLKSGAKRLLGSLSNGDLTNVATNNTATPKAQQISALQSGTISEIVDELLSRIVCKWLQIKTLDKDGNSAIASESTDIDTSLTIEDMLIIAADLIAAQPSVSVMVLRYVYNVAKVPAWAKELAKSCFPMKHAITGQSLGGLFITFVVHALLLPAKLVDPSIEVSTGLTKEAALKQRETREAALNKLAGTQLRNACSYFLASLASRPGESRKRVLNEILNGVSVGTTTVDRTSQLRSYVAFAETLQYLLAPPPSWVSRDAFILPARDILTTLTKINAHSRIAAAICSIDMTHPLALETVMVLSVPLDGIIKKGMEPGVIAAAPESEKPATTMALVAGNSNTVDAVVPAAPVPASAVTATAPSTSSSSSSQHDPTAAASSSAVTGLPPRPSTTATPVLRRSTSGPGAAPVEDNNRARTATAPLAASGGDASRAFVTPALIRHRGNTEQSLDTEERQLLLGDQHEHLMRPPSYRHDEGYSGDEMDDEEIEYDDGGDDDEEDEDGEHGGEVYLDGTELGGAGDEFDGSEEDDDDDDEDDDSDGDAGHHHHHHHHDAGESESEEDSEEGEHDDDGDSHIDSHSGDEEDEDDQSDGDEFAEEDEDDLDDSREYHDDDDDDGDDDDAQPDLEIAMEVDDEGDAGDHLEELGGIGSEDDEEIDDNEADVEDDENEAENLLNAQNSIRSGRRAGHRLSDEEDDEQEHQGEGDDDDDDDGEEEGLLDDDGEEDNLINEHSVDFAEDDGVAEFDDFHTQMHAEEADDDGAGGDDDAANAMGEDDNFWAMTAPPRPSTSRFNADPDNDGEQIVSSRARTMDRNRRQSHLPSNQPVTLANIINTIQGHRDAAGGSGIFTFPAGSMISGGVLEAQGENGRSETISFDHSGAMTRRGVFMRGGEAGPQLSDLLGNSGGDMGTSIRDLLSNILPPNVSLTSSSARVDPRTGALTFSIGGTRAEGGSSVGSSLGATAVQPPAHPLLSVTDSRRNRFLQPCVNSLAASFGMTGRAMSLSRASAGLAVTGTGGSSTFDSSNRRGQLSVRRREVGPIVSDRRWGTDIGDVEPAGARLAALTTAVECALGDSIEREPPVETRPRTASMGSNKSKRHRSSGINFLTGRLSHDSEMEDDDDEEPDFGDSDSDNDRSDDAEARSASRRIRIGYDPNETKEEEGELQETKESEPIQSGSTSTSALATLSSSTTPPDSSSQAAAVVQAEQTVGSTGGVSGRTGENSESAPTSMEVESTTEPVADNSTSSAEQPTPASAPASALAASTAPAPSSADTDASEVGLSGENILFLESLSPELRQEVLLSAEDDFLNSLPHVVRQEARALRVEMGIIEEAPEAALQVMPSAQNTRNTSPQEIDFMSAIMSLAAQPATGSTRAPVNSTETRRSSGEAANASSGAATGGAEAASSSGSTAVDSATTAAGSSNSSDVNSNAAVITTTATTTAASAPPALSAEDRKAAELAITVSLGDDRTDALPYGGHLIARLLRSFFISTKSKLPRSISKLLATACRYKNGRKWILRAIFASLTHNGERVTSCVRQIPLEGESNPAAFESELSHLSLAVDQMNHNVVNVHRVIAGMSFLFRRSDRLSWYDIMLRPLPEEDSVWLFGSIIALLGDPQHSTGENLEYLLQIMEELCGGFSKLNIKQANLLAEESMKRLDIVNQYNRKSGRSVTYAGVGGPLATIEEDVDESELPKRRRLEPASPEPTADAGTDADGPARARAASIDIEAAAEIIASNATNHSSSSAVAASEGSSSSKSEAESKESATSVGKDRYRMPFPVLQDGEAKLLCQIAGSTECNGNARKRLMRVMRHLSLCDRNWTLFLDHLATVGADLAGRATREFSDLQETLVVVAQNNENAATAMARPELSTPKSLSEVRLLSVLRVMSALRSRSNESAAAEAEVVSARVRQIQANSLWEILCDCLDIVRDLEGIVDTADEVEKTSSSGTAAMKPEEDKKVVLSSLTLRFMSLIECFLSVCATTMLVRPDAVGSSALKESQRELERLSSGFKRKHSRDEPPQVTHGITSSNSSSSSSAVLASGGQRSGRFSPSTPTASGGLGDLTSPASFARVNSMLPGSRFRQHASYFQMQMELSDDAAADRLITFAKQNRILFNNVLRNNVSLLESSFSPLVSVPKCRQLLHFDIKRAYFKLKLKRMRQSAARSHGALRLSVRRSGVFEESFQALRYKTADEMRRRLSVNFVGEEGMDAGGLTREWYGVLAREIFNPNYALFTSTGDSVTFQPNAQSYINPDHQSYFKFVGRVIGKAICDGQLLDAHFTRSFYKHILGLPVSVVDLEAIDPEYFKSLKQILNTPLDLLGLDLTFSAESNDFGVVSTVDLIPQGRDVLVTDDTKHEYVKLLAHHRMTTAIRKQIDSFLEGFHELVPSELISIFDAHELELLISGLPDIDLDDLRAYTDYQGYKSTDPEITYFWNVLKSFSKQEKALFLQFVTGTSKVPLDGFKALQGSDGTKQFNIQKAFGGTHLLPSAHTCFNQLDLPAYTSEDMLREKLMIAIKEGSEGFGFA